MSAADWAVAALLSLWFVAILLRNLPLPAVRDRLTRHDTLGLLPVWALFAWPRLNDPVLLYRRVRPDATVTGWTEIPVIVDRPWYSFVWHPQLGRKRALLTFATALETAARRRLQQRPVPHGQGTPGANLVMGTDAYLILLDMVSAHCRADDAAVQFMLVALTDQQTSGRWDTTAGGSVRFVSELHRPSPDLVRPAEAPGAVGSVVGA